MVFLWAPRRAQGQTLDPPRDWSLGAGIGIGSTGALGAPYWLGTLSLERRLGRRLAVIVLAGGNYERIDETSLVLAQAGAGLRGFLTERGDLQPSLFVTALGQYTHFGFGGDAGGGITQLGASVDASLSPRVDFRLGANLANAGYFSQENQGALTFVGFGLGPQAELRVKW